MYYRDRQDVVTTLSICALLTQDTAAVQRCAQELMEDCNTAVQKAILTPLTNAEAALEIVLDTYVFPTKEIWLGFVWRNNFEYEIIANHHDNFEYDVQDVVNVVADTFVDWGVTEGRLKLRVLHPTDGTYKYRYADLAQQATYVYATAKAA